MERRQRPRGSASVELWRTVRAAASASALCDSALSGCALSEPWHARHAVRLRAVGLRPVGATARALLLLSASALRVRAARARKCWRESAGVRADRVLASAPTEPLLGSTGQMSTAPSRRRRTASGARRTASDARPRRHGPGEHGATRATLNTGSISSRHTHSGTPRNSSSSRC